MSEPELPPPELRSLFEAERAAPRVDANARVALRARLEASVAHWDRSDTSDLDTKQEPLAPLVQDASLDELRFAKGGRGDLVHATAQEPVAAPPASGRAKGKMNIFDKRIIGAATLTAAAIGLLGVTAYKRRVHEAPDPFEGHGPAVALGRSFAMTPHASPVAPTTGADLAITAGESAWIHVPFGSVDIEIQSKCNAEVVVSVVTAIVLKPGARADDPPTVSTESKGGIIVGTHRPDGRASTYHLTPGLAAGDGMYEYTSRCVGQPPIRGNLVVDSVDANGPIGPTTNARVEALIVNEDTSVFQTPFDSLLANLPDLVGSMHAKSVFVLDDKRSVVPGGYLSQRREKEGIAFRDWFEKEIAPKLDLAPPNVLNHEFGTWGDKDYFFSFMKKQSDDRTYYVVIEEDMTKRGIVVLGAVLPDARVSIGANPVALGPADPTWDDLPIYSKFATDVPSSSDHLVAAVRVDDAKGTHFYVFHASGLKGSNRARPR